MGLANSTKVIGNVVHSVKEYIMVMELHGESSWEKIKRTVEYFKGDIYQRPPLRSSVKRNIRVKRIHDIEILDIQGRYILLRVLCDPGTYMRKLAHDIGLLLGVGAHMRELRRTRTGPYREDDTLVSLQEVSEALYMWRKENDERYLRKVILPVETSISHLPKIMILDTAVDAIAHGADLAVPGVARITDNVERGKPVAILTLKGELVALSVALKSSKEIQSMEKGIVAKTKRVIMPTNVYPPAWRH
ncbi:MAG: RNA-guided pseudouridylation complex pseudouridine synthase subunit Cbf5 [Desulfurococcaceae archaeon]